MYGRLLLRFFSLLAIAGVIFFNYTPIVFAAPDVNQRASIFFSPKTQSVLENSTFEVSFFLNTWGKSINTVDLNITFPPDLLEIVSPSAGQSLVGIWLEPPVYSNEKGTAKFIGIVPNGINASAGLVTTITFKAKTVGEATVKIDPKSKILANDGLGTEVKTEFGRGVYTITPLPPDGVRVFSETHTFSSQWYNNNDPIVSWDKDADVTDFSYTLDEQPNTIPDDVSEGGNTTTHFQGLADGLRYFHIKASKAGVWGSTSNFLMRIDTTPPAEFKPQANIVTANDGQHHVLVSFFTTDALSGIDHYEVGVIDLVNSPTVSPVFVSAESPYQVPESITGRARVIVRALDKAGNVRDVSTDIDLSVPLLLYAQQNMVLILGVILGVLLLLVLLQYIFGHRFASHIRRFMRLARAEKRIEKQKEEEVEAILEEQVEETIAGENERAHESMPDPKDTNQPPPYSGA